MRILCVFTPPFPDQLRKTEAPRPGIAPGHHYAAVGSQKLVMDYSSELKGLQREMPLQQALSLHGAAELIHADIPYYVSAFNKILDALDERSPLVEGADLGDIYIGLDGLQLLYGSDDALVSASMLPSRRFSRRISVSRKQIHCISGGFFQHPGSCKILTGDTAAFLKDLNCDLLPVSLKSKEKLHQFGLHTLGQAAALAPGPYRRNSGRKACASGNWPTAATIPLYTRVLSKKPLRKHHPAFCHRPAGSDDGGRRSNALTCLH